MLQPLLLLALLVAFCIPLFLVLWWPDRGWRFGAVLLGAVLSGWLLLICLALVAKYTHDADIFGRASLGMPVREQEYLQDGTGENAIALFLGWILPASGGVTGWTVRAMQARASKRRGFPVLPG